MRGEPLRAAQATSAGWQERATRKILLQSVAHPVGRTLLNSAVEYEIFHELK